MKKNISQQKKTNTIGKRIRELRQDKKLTQVELAQLVGCAQNTITEWEKREGRAPGKKLLGKVAQIFDVTIDYLMGVEKIDFPQIPCYQEVLSEEFVWKDKIIKTHINVPQSEYSSSRFSLKILDDLLEPTILEGDYAIFEKLPPEDGDIVVICFPAKKNKTIIRMWRQQKNSVILTETKLYKFCLPHFLEIVRGSKNLEYIDKNKNIKFSVKGKLVAVKRIGRSIAISPRVHYILQ